METQATTSTVHSAEEDLEQLLQVFGSQFSLKEIASAYARANGNLVRAIDNLYGAHGETSGTDPAEKLEGQNVHFMSLFSGQECESSTENALQKVSDGGNCSKELKMKKSLASMGTVSGIIGKEYAIRKPAKNGPVETSKPLKLDSKDFPVPVICREENASIMAQRTHSDVEEFLLEILGDGFQLDEVMIWEVLGVYGHDIHKSIDKLLELSTSPLQKYDESAQMSAKEATEEISEQESFSHQEQMQQAEADESSNGADLEARNPEVTMTRKENRAGLENEILVSLFNVPDRTEEPPKRILRSFLKSWKLYKPPEDVNGNRKQRAIEPAATTEGATIEVEEDEREYKATRQAVKEYWTTMRAYYKAAVDAFIDGDQAKANKLLEQGKFFKKRAQETEEESCQKLVAVKEDEVVSLNLNGLDPKAAVHLLKVHLASLSGIATVKFLRIKLADGDKDRCAQKKLIIKRLDKESIKWTDMNNGQTMLVQLDVIETKGLSFAEKYS